LFPTVLSAVLGVLAGLVGFSPLLFVGLQVKGGHFLVRRYAIPTGMVGITASFILLLALILIAWRVAPEMFLAFAIALVLTFLIANTWYALRENRR
jgi:hypothetical protein